MKHRTIGQIVRDLRVSRNTVRKVVRSEETAFKYEREVQPRPALGIWVVELDRLLDANAARPARERVNLMRIYEHLSELGYTGSYSAVRRYARGREQRAGVATSDAFVPLSFAPGEAYQFDWSHDFAVINGVTMTLKIAHVRLSYSRMPFIRAYPRETQEMVFDAHDRAFAFFKGTCQRGIYDNMKTAVDAVFVGKDRAFNRRFAQMCSHYLVEPVACTPASGWEKGQVENQVGVMRERFFKPTPRFRSIEELNGWLLDQCVALTKRQSHPEQKERSVWDVFEEERAALIPYRGRFDGFHAVPAARLWQHAPHAAPPALSKTCLVRIDNNKYSVAAHAVGRPVDVHAYADRIIIKQDGVIVGDHPRSFGRSKTIFDPWHYVPVVARKPGALRNGAPFKDWVLPGALGKIRKVLAGSDDGDRQMVAILNAVLTEGMDAVEAACAEALTAGTHSSDVILNILARHRDPPPALTIVTPDTLILRHQPVADCHRYDTLRSMTYGTP